ncbi:hypothetical protein EHQ23_12760 [Leptospira bourretii]|uniref:DUF1554 domain-containing protein n=1 Tax=Leptospira bourretii TaxID=2484962 RepID=A0A4R9IR37_9LEPT|nr:DUF1554 domain-containing protein [Leptospira bourretii]TGK85514.1 hypothetical protein EHQ23_12760 [Leptospira bourretii]TGK94409.1 hypothetical protein EHQ26_00190 [Leptospira bourretii]TGL24766.1 hypothetical protein EHQ47_02120 [Leptospira bourretii]TGL42917.1 hypothetical protein EHQ45_01300 [Leptospira bourretii]
MRWNFFVSILSLGWFLSCNQVNPRDELLFTLISGLNPVSSTSTSVSVSSSAKINVSSTSVLLKYGTPQNFGISLVKLPTANVTASFTFTNTKLTVDGSATSPSPTVLTFTPSNYNVVQTISLNSITQILDSSSLTITVTSADPFYNTSGAVSISHQNIYMAYTGNSFIFQNAVAAPTLTPSITFVITNCSVTPSLPTGLSLNASNCVISGTPTSGTQPATSYAVTATNGTDSDTHNISIQIEPTVYKVFITAATFNGNLQGAAADGPAGADLKCNADTNKPSTGTYKAMLTTDGGARVACTSDNCSGGVGENTDWVFQSGRIYIRASDSASLLSPNAAGILPADSSDNFTTNPYSLNHSFDSGTTKEYWTGFAQSNYWQTATQETENTCNNWTINVGPSPTSDGGRVGASNSTNYSAFRNGSGRSCASSYYLVCVEY